METTVIYFIKLMMLPPASLLLMAFIGLRFRKHRIGLPLTIASLLLLTLLSLPIVSEIIAGTLESYPVLTNRKIKEFAPQAIVVLGGGSTSGHEYHQFQTVNTRTLLRLRFAAKLARDTGLPVLVSGGKVFTGTELAEATLMTEVLQNEFGIPVRWQESSSRNTAENASFSRKLLQTLSIDKIMLVTQAYHMPRSVLAFRNAGFQVLPAPTAFISRPSLQYSILYFVPSASALEQSFLVLHEYLGLLWYQFTLPPLK